MRSFHALALLRCVAVRGDRNHCNHHEVVADVDGTRAVHKTFKVLHGRGPVMASKSGACRRNKYSGLLPAQAYAIEVSVLTRLNERPRNASGACRGRYFPRLLRRDDAGLSFLQSHEGERIVTAWWHGRNPRPRVNRRFCALPRGEIACFATCATAALKAARVHTWIRSTSRRPRRIPCCATENSRSSSSHRLRHLPALWFPPDEGARGSAPRAPVGAALRRAPPGGPGAALQRHRSPMEWLCAATAARPRRRDPRGHVPRRDP